MKRRILLSAFITWLVIISGISDLSAMPVDLNSFTPGLDVPPDRVVIALDGSSATLSEDFVVSPISLENGGFIIPSDALALSFDYELVVAIDNVDFFDFYIINTEAPTFPVGGSEGLYSGNYSYDLTALRGNTVPVIFHLLYDWTDGGYESILTISNVEITQVAAVPEPATLLLLLSGVAGLLGFNRRKLRDSE